MAVTLDQVMQMLADEGYENFREYNGQIIVNNRGEIDVYDGAASVNNRIGGDYGPNKRFHHINEVKLVVKSLWTRAEPK
jgi:hypothetical protein